MRFHIRETVIMAFLAAAAASCLNPDSPTEPFDKLRGRWVASGEDGKTVEQWQTGYGTTLLEGAAYRVNGNDSTLTETLSIATTDSGIYYVAVVRGQNNERPVSFRLIPSEEGRLVFVNPEHDFRKKITYIYKGTDSLKVDVEGDSVSFSLLFGRN